MAGFEVAMTGRFWVATGVLSQNFDRLLDGLDQAQESIVNAQKQQVVTQTARQVAHDIKSPLVALKTATSNISPLPEEQRIMIREATQRIEDIANTLSSKSSAGIAEKNVSDKLSSRLLSSLISLLVTEKRLQYRSKIGITIEAILDESSYGLFAKVQPVEFRRVLSNLIDNAVDALDDKGHVIINLYAEDDGCKANKQIALTVSDNGKGIPSDILPNLMVREFTYGKEDNQKSGLGLGLFHARKSVKSWAGDISIESVLGKGTKVIINLPKEPAPDWFVPEIKIRDDLCVVVLDDDTSIHHIWQSRFDAVHFNKDNIVHMTTPEEVFSWHKAHRDCKNSHLYLFDYELLKRDTNGLDIIKKLGIAEESILVTSRFEDTVVRMGCSSLGIKLLPKNLANLVPIVSTDNNGHLDSPLEPSRIERYDAVLIDDDSLIHTTWKMGGKKVAAFKDPEEFFARMQSIDRKTSIYIDSNLSEGLRGEEVARKIHAMGFENIYIETGYDSSEFADMPWVKGVVGKDPPW